MRANKNYTLLLILIVSMGIMVLGLRGKGQQNTVLDASNLNSLESCYYLKLGDTIWQDQLNNSSQWQLSYSHPDMTAALSADGAMHLNASIQQEPFSQAVNIYREMNLSLARDPVMLISLEASIGTHYGIRLIGQDGTGNQFQAWSESSTLQHRNGLGQIENFTISAMMEAFSVNGIFPTKGSRITSLTFYLEAIPNQHGLSYLNIYRIAAVAQDHYQFNSTSEVMDRMDGVALVLNDLNNLGYAYYQFDHGYIDYYIKGTSDLTYTVFFLHGLTVIGQGYYYSASSLTYNVATFSVSDISNYPSLFIGNDSYAIVLSPLRGSILQFQLNGFSIRYLSESPPTSTPANIDPTYILFYYFAFLFVTPIAAVILVARLSDHGTKQIS